MSKKTPAQQLTESVIRLFTLHGWFIWRGGSTAGRNAQGDFYRTGTPGAPDLYAIRGLRYVLIEIKAGKDVLRPSQIKFQQRVDAAYGTYIVVRNLDDAISWIQGE